MKKMAWILTFATVLTGTLFAQSIGNTRIVTQVPFEFVVGTHVMPAGQVVVQSATQDGGMLVIRNSAAKRNMLSSTILDESKAPASGYALVFNRYGDQYFLSSIKLQDSNLVYRLQESKAEAELRAQASPTTLEVAAGH